MYLSSRFRFCAVEALRAWATEPSGDGLPADVRVIRHDQEVGAQDGSLHLGGLAGNFSPGVDIMRQGLVCS